MALILAIDRRVPDAALSLRSGVFDKREYGKARGLFGQAIGIAGLGAIGREVLARAHAFGLVAHAWSRSLSLRPCLVAAVCSGPTRRRVFCLLIDS